MTRTMPPRLSKSKLMALRQCERRLWLELHQPALRQDNAASHAAFATGHQVGGVARSLYDPDGAGVLLDPHSEGFDAALARSRVLLDARQPVFEAGFAAGGALAFADVLLPLADGGWRMVEVKSSTSVKDYQRDDAAIQAYVARQAGVPLAAIAVAHIDSDWVYPGGGDYRGLLAEHDLTASAFARADEVQDWIARAQAVAALPAEPAIAPGAQCSAPYDCGFMQHCHADAPQAEFPVSWLPRVVKRELKECIAAGASDMRDVPDHLLNPTQQRVKQHTISGQPFFDAAGARNDLARHTLPAWFIDFETINLALPVWPGTRPFQMIPFQFSVHRLDAQGALDHRAFLDLSGNDPSQAFAGALLDACDGAGPVFVYNAAFETARIAELAQRFPALATPLMALNARVVDLLPVARNRYYHPIQQGSWSIKRVLPAIAPDLCYDQLDGVQNGGGAMQAFLEALDGATTPERRRDIERQLLDYCHLDTLAMVRLWRFLAGAE